jgi:hypothetical protein
MKCLILASISFLTTGCHNSPLFNHKVEERSPPFSGLRVLDQCQFKTQDSQFCLEVSWSVTPQVNVDSSFIFRLTTLDKIGVALQNVEVDLWMPDMGHGSSPVSIRKIEDDKYQVQDVYFIMPGLWHVRIKMQDVSGRSYSAVLELTL